LAGATSALTVVNNAIAMIDDYRVDVGSVGNRLDFAVMNLYSRIEYQAAAKSRVLDADYAVESARLAKSQVLQSAGTAMLAQANASSANVMSLLK
jgi:flagellin